MTRYAITTQRTSKPLKAHLAFSSFLFWFGLLGWFLHYGHSAEIAGMPWSAAIMIAGTVWYVGARVMVWWRHG